MVDTCTVTATSRDFEHAVRPGDVFVFTPRLRQASGGIDSVYVPLPISVTADEAGEISVALVPAQYYLTISGANDVRKAAVTIPDAETASLGACIDLAATPPTMSELQDLVSTAQQIADEFGDLASAQDSIDAAVELAESSAQATAQDRLAAAASAAAAALAVTNAQAAALTVATWTALAALTSSVAGTGAEVLDSDTGVHTDPVVGGTVNNAGRYSWSASPQGWQRIGDTGLSGKAGVYVETEVQQRAKQYVVGAFGSALSVTFNRLGVPIAAKMPTDRIRRAYVVGRMGNAVSLTMTSAGVPVAAQFERGEAPSDFPVGDAVATEGALELRTVPGVITGRSVDQVFLRRGPGIYAPLTGGASPVTLISSDTVSGSAVIRRAGVERPLKWRPTPLGDGLTMHLGLHIGQSLTQGHVDTGQTERVPYWRDLVCPERAWQFQAGDGVQRGPRVAQYFPTAGNKAVPLDPTQIERLEPLRGARHANNQQYAQTACETAALALLGQHLHRNDHYLGAVVGTGSTAVADFAVGSQHYLNALMVIDAAYEQAVARSLGLTVWLVWNQGEEDNDLGTSQATYEATWLALRDGIAAHVAGLGAADFGGTVIMQTLRRLSGLTGMATLAHASLIAAGEALGVMPVAMSDVPYSGSTHILPLTYLPLGAAIGYEISRMIAGGSPATPHVAAGGAVLTTGTQIDCTISGGTGTFLFDDTLSRDSTYGVRVANADGDCPISAIAFTGANTLRITLASPILIGSAPVVSFGLYGSGANSSRVSIRDNSEWPCPCTGNIVSGWMMHHKVNCV